MRLSSSRFFKGVESGRCIPIQVRSCLNTKMHDIFLDCVDSILRRARIVPGCSSHELPFEMVTR